MSKKCEHNIPNYLCDKCFPTAERTLGQENTALRAKLDEARAELEDMRAMAKRVKDAEAEVEKQKENVKYWHDRAHERCQDHIVRAEKAEAEVEKRKRVDEAAKKVMGAFVLTKYGWTCREGESPDAECQVKMGEAHIKELAEALAALRDDAKGQGDK